MVRYLALIGTIGIGTLGMGSAALAQTNPAPKPPVNRPAASPLPSAQTQIILIRSTVIAVSHANATNNYSVLYGLGSPAFRSANSPEKLQSLFTNFRANKIDMTPVSLLSPQLSYQPVIENGRLRLVGFFPSQPMRVNYDLSFDFVGGGWQMAALSINLVKAPAQVAAPAPTPKTAPKPKRP